MGVGIRLIISVLMYDMHITMDVRSKSSFIL